MAFWVVRAGKHGENEAYALEHNLISIGWEDLGDLTGVIDREALQRRMAETHPDSQLGTTRMWTGEVWALKDRMKVGDLVALPMKARSAVAFGRIVGPYRYSSEGPFDGKHQRDVRWLRTDFPRTDLDQDLLYSIGGTLTVFQVQRNNAEARIEALLGERRAARLEPDAVENGQNDPVDAPADIAQIASDQIMSHIGSKFRGHDLPRLVAGILTAQGYKVEVSPPGADGGVDIIAGMGPMGFDVPRLIVQVKSGDSPSDVSVIRELEGVMRRFGADQCLFVSWAGFRSSVFKEFRQNYFKVRLWDAGTLVAALLECYEKLEPDLQAELPLKRIWMIAGD
jgi:restriction system protein